MESLSTPQAQADWQEWKSAAQREATVGSPVQRRPVRGDEPPSLVIMRDYFGVVLAALLTVVSFLFAFLAFALRGSVRSGSPVDGASAETVK